MTSAERFVTLLAAALASLAVMGGGLAVLMRVSWRIAQLVQQFSDHVDMSSETHEDQEQRLRALERERRRGR